MIWNGTPIIPTTNQSGGALSQGDVVIWTTGGVTTTTTEADPKVASSVAIGGADGETVWLYVPGFAMRVNVVASVDNIAPGARLVTSTTAGSAREAETVSAEKQRVAFAKAREAATADGVLIDAT